MLRTNKGKPIRLVQSYSLALHMSRPDGTHYWRCTKSNVCNARGQSAGLEGVIRMTQPDHTHAVDLVSPVVRNSTLILWCVPTDLEKGSHLAGERSSLVEPCNCYSQLGSRCSRAPFPSGASAVSVATSAATDGCTSSQSARRKGRQLEAG